MVSGNGRPSPNPLFSKLCQHAESIFVEIFPSLGHTHTHLLVLQVGQVTGWLVDPSAHPHSTARGIGGGLLDSLVAGEESGPGG